MMGDESWISLYFVVYLHKIKREQKKLYDLWMVLKNEFLGQILAIHDYEFAPTHRRARYLPNVEKPGCLLYSYIAKQFFSAGDHVTRSLWKSSSFNGHWPLSDKMDSDSFLLFGATHCTDNL